MNDFNGDMFDGEEVPEELKRVLGSLRSLFEGAEKLKSEMSDKIKSSVPAVPVEIAGKNYLFIHDRDGVPDYVLDGMKDDVIVYDRTNFDLEEFTKRVNKVKEPLNSITDRHKGVMAISLGVQNMGPEIGLKLLGEGLEDYQVEAISKDVISVLEKTRMELRMHVTVEDREWLYEINPTLSDKAVGDLVEELNKEQDVLEFLNSLE